MDGAVAVAEKSVAERSLKIVDDDYSMLDDMRLSQVEAQRGRSADIAVPWLLWPVFVVSITVGASAATATKTMRGAAPVSLGCWRLQVSALAALPFFLVEWIKLPKFDRDNVLSIHSLGLYLVSSIALAGNVGFFLWSLDHTSMIHCLFLVCIPSIFVAIYTNIVGGVLLPGEIIGVSLGLVGVAVLAAGTELETDKESTHIGDFVGLLSAASMAAHLIVGKKLRSWMPLFVYQFPVVFLGSIILGVVGLLLEGWNDSGAEISGPIGWIRKEYIVGTIYLGIGPGLVAHAGYSFVLPYSAPLVMPTGLSLQPIIGSALGWAFNEAPLPGLWTCLGGAVTLAGTLLVSCSRAGKTKAEKVEIEDEGYKPPTTDDGGEQGTKLPLLQPSELP